MLTHLCRLYFPILINWTSQFPILGLLGGSFFHFHSNLKRNFCNASSGDPDQTLRSAVSGLVLHYLPTSYKKGR